MYHVGYGAYLVYRIEHYDRLRRVGHADGDAFARLNAYGRQGSGALVHLGYKVLVLHFSAHEVVGDMIGKILRNFCHSVVHRSFVVVQMRRYPS